VPLSKEEQEELSRLEAWEKTQRRPAEYAAEPSTGEKVRALAYGAGTGLAGSAGELEKFAAYDVPEMIGTREKGAPRGKVFGRETIFPTIEEARGLASKVGIERPREEVRGSEDVGEVLGGFATAVPSAARGTAKALLGRPTKTSEALAKEAEFLGFKLSPAQVRGDVPTPAKGATFFADRNQTLANKLASKGTGKEAAEITDDFIRGRIKDVGKEFDKVYKGKVFNIDQDAVNAIYEIGAREAAMPGVARTSSVAKTADEIIGNFSALASRKGAQPNTFGIEGDALQSLRNALAEKARSTTSRSDAHEIYNLIDVIDQSVARNHPNVAATLDVIRPQYRNSVILEDLYRNGGIRQGNISLEKLGEMLRGKRDAVRRTGMDIDNLGELGRELKLRARWETEGRASLPGQDVVGKLLGTGTDLASTLTGMRTRPARAVQRFYASQPETTTKLGLGLAGAPKAMAAGTATRPFQQSEE